MKKNKFTEFLKGKGYYVLLFVGVLAIAAVAYIGSNIAPEPFDDGQNLVDLNDTDIDMADMDNDGLLTDNDQTAGEDVANNAGDNVNDADTNENDGSVVDTGNLPDDVFTQDEVEGVDLTDTQAEVTTVPNNDQDLAVEETEEEPVSNTVEANANSIVGNLSFQAENGLLWPVDGNVIMKYSMDRTILHATLKTYKVNPAIVIDAEVGTKVKAATKGIITSIDNSSETGITVTTAIGDGFSLVYGQLKDVTFKVGERVNEGEVIGVVDEPTKYYSVEGSNLYFQVLNDNETVDPMLYLR